jgi:hypothetical protein
MGGNIGVNNNINNKQRNIKNQMTLNKQLSRDGVGPSAFDADGVVLYKSCCDPNVLLDTVDQYLLESWSHRQ